ncbi:MAG: TrbI/VirB10 family protein [Alphaproteobacteria bacterium]|nr:TrbI/VirB10 family protein [Alphaproteobacteria bacterium]
MTDTTMGASGAPKVDPESLVLRASPRRVTRFKRHVVIGVVSALVIGVFAAAWIALRASPLARPTSGDELYNIDRKPKADGLATLPSTYDKVKPPTLGPALPGDLGPAELRARHGLGVGSEDDGARAEELRQAQLARQAREGGVFFQSGASHAGGMGAVLPTAPGVVPSIDPAASPSDHVALDPARDPGDVQRKLDFVNAHDDRTIYNPHAIQDPVSPYEVMAGTLISASLITGLDSDLPGLVVGQVTQNVYDTVTGRTLLIPQGSRLIGTYDSVIAFGQSRALVVWQRIIMPDGSSIQIDNLPATDAQGYSGLEDDVDYHTWALIKGVAISTLLGIGSELSLTGQSDLLLSIRESTQDSVNQAGQQLTQKNLNIQPTIKVRPGWPLRVIVHKDLVLRPYHG